MAALAVALREQGAEAVVAAPPDPANIQLLERLGVDFAPVFMPVQQWMAQMRTRGAGIPELAAEIMSAYFMDLAAAAEGCDAIVAGGLFPSAASAHAVAEKMNLKFFYGTFCPLWLPSEHHRPFGFPGYPPPEGETDNRVLWDVDARAMDGIFAKALNENRRSIGLEPIATIRNHVFTSHPLLAADPILAPWLPTGLCDTVQTGAWTIRDDRELPADILAFLEAGAPPIYVGFGSMSQDTLSATAAAAIAAARGMGHRVIVSSGWAGIAAGDPDCFLIAEVNQQKLFPRVGAVVHHGGAGTTTTAMFAGVPQVVIPQMADQPYFASRVELLGIGAGLQEASPTEAAVAAAIRRSIATPICQKAKVVSGTAIDNGSEVAAKLILSNL